MGTSVKEELNKLGIKGSNQMTLEDFGSWGAFSDAVCTELSPRSTDAYFTKPLTFNKEN